MVPPKNYSSAPNINLGERVGYIKKRYMFNKPINKVSQRTFPSHLLFYPLPNLPFHYIIRCKVRQCINCVNIQTLFVLNVCNYKQCSIFALSNKQTKLVCTKRELAACISRNTHNP